MADCSHFKLCIIAEEPGPILLVLAPRVRGSACISWCVVGRRFWYCVCVGTLVRASQFEPSFRVIIRMTSIAVPSLRFLVCVVALLRFPICDVEARLIRDLVAFRTPFLAGYL